MEISPGIRSEASAVASRVILDAIVCNTGFPDTLKKKVKMKNKRKKEGYIPPVKGGTSVTDNTDTPSA